jgi:parvulin-like peptidyl-prolyl isomerase
LDRVFQGSFSGFLPRLTLRALFPKVTLVRVLMILLLAFSTLACSRAATPQLVNGIAVIVGDAVITYKDIQLALGDDLDFLRRQYGADSEVYKEKAAELQKSKLEEMVENELVLQEFKRAGYVIPDSWVQNQIKEDIRKVGDRLTLISTLQAQGITFEKYREKTREREILRQMWLLKVPRDPLISPAKIENYYAHHLPDFKMEDQVKLRMIVLTNSPGVSNVEMAKEIIAKLDQKVPFEELAKIYSQDSKASSGGERGWMEKKVLRSDLAKAAFALEPGEHSQPIETSDGTYILLVEDKKVSYTQTLSEVRDQIEATLRTEETKRLRKQWVDQLKAKTFIRYF